MNCPCDLYREDVIKLNCHADLLCTAKYDDKTRGVERVCGMRINQHPRQPEGELFL